MTKEEELAREALQLAHDRLADMLRGDDGQAWKEAERAMPLIKAALDLLRVVPAEQAQAADRVQVVGVKSDGAHHNLGTMPMPARMKAREVVLEMLGPIDEEAGNDAAMALWACEQVLEYVEKQQAQAAQAAPAEPAEPVAWIPADALQQLQPPRLRLLSVPLVTYSAVGHVPLYTAPQPVEVQWQPIETAPKDGTVIVVRGNNHGWPENGHHICIATWQYDCWIEGSDWNDTSELTYLTHWMPLPAAPGAAAPEEPTQ